MSSGGPPIIIVGDTPISVPESLEPVSEGPLAPDSDIGEMPQIPQIHMASPFCVCRKRMKLGPSIFGMTVFLLFYLVQSVMGVLSQALGSLLLQQ